MKALYIATVMFLMMCMTACRTSNQNMTYFTDIDTLQEIPLGDYLTKIQPADQLMITVTSKDHLATADYNLAYINPSERQSRTRNGIAEQQTYTVDSEGYIDFPVLGRLHVAGMTNEQLKDYLTKLISKDVEDPIVTITTINPYVDVMGEVVRPGRINISSPRFTILDALAVCGDLNQYGRRDNVLLVREVDGKRIHARLNLNSAETLASPYFYVKQNDVIYVEPNNIRKDNAEYNQFNSYRLSVIATVVSGSASIISLIIALSR